jgi:hypothetical protein
MNWKVPVVLGAIAVSISFAIFTFVNVASHEQDRVTKNRSRIETNEANLNKLLRCLSVSKNAQLCIDGVIGAQGPGGATGRTGMSGQRGLQGIRGIRGPKGERGPRGRSGRTVGPAPPISDARLREQLQVLCGESCRGRDGTNGKDGKNGIDGAPGMDGTNAPPVGPSSAPMPPCTMLDQSLGYQCAPPTSTTPVPTP